MTALERSLREIVTFLEARSVPYMIIGGIANLVWGIPRTTLDIDLTVWVEPEREKALIRDLLGFKALPEDPEQFVHETRVLPLLVSDFRVDVIFGGLPYEEQAIRRAKPVEMAGRLVRVCSPEDLIIHKIISERPKDIEDIRGVIRATGGALDRGYLDPLVRGLARDIGRPEIWETFQDALKGL